VNNMCLALKKPLIESGTAGFLGQCTAIIPVLKLTIFTFFQLIRDELNATTVLARMYRRPLLSAQFAPLPRHRFIASSGLKITFYRIFLEISR